MAKILVYLYEEYKIFKLATKSSISLNLDLGIIFAHANQISIYKRLKLDLRPFMRHLVTISLVFFSLTHLAKTDRVQEIRYFAERYCAKQQAATEQLSVRPVQDLQDLPHFLLSNNQLSAIGTLSSKNCIKYRIVNQALPFSAVLENPRNNSP